MLLSCNQYYTTIIMQQNILDFTIYILKYLRENTSIYFLIIQEKMT